MVFGGDILQTLFLLSKANSSTGPDNFGSLTSRQVFVYLLRIEYKELRAMLEEAHKHAVFV
jgi:hypothetical protein